MWDPINSIKIAGMDLGKSLLIGEMVDYQRLCHWSQCHFLSHQSLTGEIPKYSAFPVLVFQGHMIASIPVLT